MLNKGPELSFSGLTDIGLSRPNNEDVWVALPELGFFALADGMGGHQAGEVAAKEAIDQLCLELQAHWVDQKVTHPVERLRRAIEKANQRVYEKGRNTQSLSGMGTTLCCLYCTEDSIVYAHVGDSRIYRYRNRLLQQLTQDHSLFAKWLSTDRKASECETPYPYKNVITRAIGTCKRVVPEIAVDTLQSGDLYILCSDGLSDALTIQDIEKIIERSENLDIAAARLIEKAKIKGSSDNITVLLIQCLADGKNLFRQQFDNSPRSKSLPSDVGRSERPSSQSI